MTSGVLAGLTFPHLEYNPISACFLALHDAERRTMPETPGAAGGAPGGAAFGQKPRKPIRCRTRAPARRTRNPFSSRLADELSQRFVTRVPRHTLAPPGSISSQEEMKTGQGSAAPFNAADDRSCVFGEFRTRQLSHGLSHFVPNKSARCALYFHAKEKIIAVRRSLSMTAGQPSR